MKTILKKSSRFRAIVTLCIVVFLSVSCEKSELEPQVFFTPCQQEILRSNSLSDKVDVAFTSRGVQITYYNFAVTCDFTTVDVTHTFVNGVLNITQQGYPNQADCICFTDVSYTIDGISQNEVNVIFINDVQVYCYNDNGQPDCDQDVIISQAEFENAPNFPLSIIDMKIVNNCLKIKFSSSGCSGESWIVKLIDLGDIAESIPCQRTLRLSLDNKETCAAIVTKEISFNIEDLQIKGDNRVLLNVLENGILYEY